MKIQLERDLFIFIVVIGLCLSSIVQTQPIQNENLGEQENFPIDIWQRYRHDKAVRAEIFRWFLRKFNEDQNYNKQVQHDAHKRSKLNLHTNLNLPRYLREIE